MMILLNTSEAFLIRTWYLGYCERIILIIMFNILNKMIENKVLSFQKLL